MNESWMDLSYVSSSSYFPKVLSANWIQMNVYLIEQQN